jgi:hypothetical protein
MKIRGIQMNIFIIVIFSLVFFLGAGPAFAQNYVGIILSGHEKDCEVAHQGKIFQCKDRRQVYIGDIITKKPSITLLKIKWAPYVNGAIKNEISMEAASSPPEKLKGKTYAAGLKQYIDDFVKPTEHEAIPLVTRGKRPKVELPSHATLMEDYPIEISGPNEDIRSITIVDMKGQKVYENLIKSKGPVSLTPREIGIKPFETYTVYINKDSAKRKLDILLMDGTTQEEVLTGLADIDRENLPKPDNLIEKVAYLQLISDAYPDKIDLYWLGHQLLQKNMYQFTKEQQEVINALTQRYNNHYRKTE